MSVKLLAICPHPPLILEKIGKENSEKLKKTKKALEKINLELENNKIESLIIITDNKNKLDNAFSINMGIIENNEAIYKSNYNDFGLLEYNNRWEVDLELSLKIKSKLESKLAIQLLSNEYLHYHNTIPLEFFKKNLKILALISSNLNKGTHLELGRQLNEILNNLNKNIAIIISGDLNHSQTDENNYPNKFDELIRSSLNHKRYYKILDISKEQLKENINSIYNPLLILLGFLENYNWKFEEYSYEHPFNISYLSGIIKTE